MKSVLYCRRTFIAVFSITCLTALSFVKGFDVSMAIASISIGLAASNAAEGASKAKGTLRNDANT